MERELFQMYDTDVWGTCSSRLNIGIYSSVQNALYSLVKDPKTGNADVIRLIGIFREENVVKFIKSNFAGL